MSMKEANVTLPIEPKGKEFIKELIEASPEQLKNLSKMDAYMTQTTEGERSDEMGQVTSEWLTAVRDATGEKIVRLQVGLSKPTKGDSAGLAPLLRSLRYCRSLVIAEVAPDAKMLSWLDLIFCLIADLVVVDDVSKEIPIDQEEPIELQGFTQDLWSRACGNAMSDKEIDVPSYPTTLSDLRKAHVINSKEEADKVLSFDPVHLPQFLLAYRRAGGVRADATQKGGFNYYMVTKVLALQALKRTPASTMGVDKEKKKEANADFSPIKWEKKSNGSKDILDITLHAEVVDLTQKDLWAQMKPLCDMTNIERINVTLAAASEEWLQRTYPAEVTRKEQSMFKWYRKWELLLGKLMRCAPVHCMLCGPTCPALLELFFGAKVRTISFAAGRIGFYCSGFMPGPSMFQALNHLGSATLKKMLLQGLEIEEAIQLGVVAKEGAESMLPQEAAPKMAVPPILRLMQSVPQANYKEQKTEYDELPTLASMVGLSLTLPGKQHEMTQPQVCTRLGLDGSPLGSFFKADHIETRSLANIGDPKYGLVQVNERGQELPCLSKDPETSPGQGALTQKHLRWARAMLAEAVTAACSDAGRPVSDVSYISVCTSSGYLLPGLTAYVVNDLKLRHNIARCDIVGMGCHAGPNSLQAAVNWAHAHPGKLAIACGVEVLSASFIWNAKNKEGGMDGANINNALCNSLFSDGCFAAAICKAKNNVVKPPCYLDFHEFKAQCSTPAMHTMTYQWSDEESQFWFFLSEEAPYAVGGGINQMVQDMQDDGLPLEHIRHFVMHTGGETVIEAASASLGIDLAEVQPTQEALRSYGNNSSGSFMFAFEKMLGAPPCGTIVPGDLGAFMTMGPGAGFEFCLWSAGELSATELMIKATVGESVSGDLQLMQGVPESSASESPLEDESTPDDSLEEDQKILAHKKGRKASLSSVSMSTLATETDRKLLQEARKQYALVRRVEDPPLSLGVVGSIAGADRHFRRGLLGKREDRTGPHLLFEGDGFQTDFPDNPVTKYLYKSMSSDTLCDMLSPKTPGSARSSQHFSPLVRKSSFMADVLESIPRRGSMRNFLGN
mmetsp:Transcript_149678/g.274997  ORF Transcript_149678/g.274997 Transcript_149678/m.274997 type:complete len:1069 (-) Transcript_149678:287-3493(-)